MLEQKSTIIVGGRELSIPSVYVKFYDTYIGTSLENMAQIYLCTEYKAYKLADAINNKTDQNLIDTILSWADAEIATMGVSLADVQ